MQCSSKLVDVANTLGKLKGIKRRERWIQETNWVKGKGTVENLVDFVTTKANTTTYNYICRNCQHFAEKISEMLIRKARNFITVRSAPS